MKHHNHQPRLFKNTALALLLSVACFSPLAVAATTAELKAQAKQHYANKDFTQAFATYEQAAQQGDAHAMAWVGTFYFNGYGMPKDLNQAISWYTKAANAGDGWSMDKLGDIYRKGEGVAKDETKATGWYQKAAAKGEEDAMSWLFIFYRDGRGGLPKNEAKAIEWLKKAAEAGDDWAMDILGDRYRKGLGVEQDYSKAMQWYQKAADKGNASAMYNIGYMYTKGLGVTQDYTKAMQWLLKAATKGNSDAMHGIGVFHLKGLGTPFNENEANRWFVKAADAGHTKAMHDIGVSNFNNKNFDDSLKWFQKASDLGYPESYHLLGLHYHLGYGITKDYDKAMNYYIKTVESNAYNAYMAMHNIGLMYGNGEGVSQDYTKARQWYLKAAQLENSISMNNLGNLYLFGLGVEKDYNKAASWYIKSINNIDDSIDLKSYDNKGEQDNFRDIVTSNLKTLLTTNKITDPAIRKQVEAIFAKPPLITWQSTPPNQISDENVTLTVSLTDQGGGIGDVRLLLDGVAIDHSTRGISRNVNQTTRSFNITLPKGTHKLTVQAYPSENSGYAQEIHHTITSTYQPVQKPKLHAVVVGINTYQDPSLNLKHATGDANAVHQQLIKQTGGVYDQGQITLLNTPSNTTKASIINALENITKTAQMNDVFVFYAASHGYNYPALGYYLYTSEVSGTSDTAIKRTGIAGDDLEDLLAQVKTNKKLILLDSCASGGAINASALISTRGTNDQLMVDAMKAKSGAMVMMASTSQQQAIEGYQGHGLFTYSVLQGLQGKADMNNDGWTQTGELKMFVENDVETLSKQVFKQVQNPKASSEGDTFGFKVL